MHGSGKSDRPIVPGKPSNKAAGAPAAAEGVGGKGPGQGEFVAVSLEPDSVPENSDVDAVADTVGDETEQEEQLTESGLGAGSGRSWTAIDHEGTQVLRHRGSSLSASTPARHYLRQEPSAVVPACLGSARGAARQRAVLPQPPKGGVRRRYWGERPERRPKAVKKSPGPSLFFATSKELRDGMREVFKTFVARYYEASSLLVQRCQGKGQYNPAEEFPLGCFPLAMPFVGATPPQSADPAESSD